MARWIIDYKTSEDGPMIVETRNWKYIAQTWHKKYAERICNEHSEVIRLRRQNKIMREFLQNNYKPEDLTFWKSAGLGE